MTSLSFRSPPSVNISFPDDDTHSEYSASETPFRPVLIKLLIWIILLGLFGTSLTISISYWLRHEEIYAKYSWNAHNCTILSARVEQNSENNTRYRIIANVTMATLPTLNQNTTAYYGPSPTYTLTKQAANKSYTNLTIGNTICWVRLISPARVSITKITKSHIPFNNTIYVAWSATFLAALSGVLFLIVFSQNLNNFLEQRTLGPDGVTITAATKSPFLSSQQTRHVCRMYADNVSAADLNDWTCSICLEQDSHAEVVNTVRLPCQHRFHRLCIRPWLRKGKGACPLCNWDAKTLFDTHGDPIIGESMASEMASDRNNAPETAAHVLIDMLPDVEQAPQREAGTH